MDTQRSARAYSLTTRERTCLPPGSRVATDQTRFAPQLRRNQPHQTLRGSSRIPEGRARHAVPLPGLLMEPEVRACCKTGWCARAYRRKTRNDSLLGSDAAPRSRPKIASIWSRIQRSKVVSGLARLGVDVISSLSLPTTKKPRPGRVAASTSRRSLQSGTTRPQVRLTRTEHLGYDAADIRFSG